MAEDNRTGVCARLAAAAAVCTVLSACATPGAVGPSGPSAPAFQGKPIYGLERGSHLPGAFPDGDREAIALAAGDLVSSNVSGAIRNWSAATGDSGQVRLGGTILVGLDATSGAPVTAPDQIDTSVALEPTGSNYVTTKNANVRLGASSTAMVSQMLPTGTTVRAYGYDRSGDWYLIGNFDSVLGYVSGQLLKPAAGGDPVLAGGTAKRPRLCRDVNLTLTTSDSKSDSWTSLVCASGGGWEVPAERGLT